MLEPRVRIAVLLVAAALLAVVAAIGPAIVDVAAVCLVFVIGITLGRVLPQSLPRVADAVGPRRAVAAGAAVAAAGAVLLLPGLTGGDDGESRAEQTVSTPGAAATVAAPRDVEHRAGGAFVVDGVRFRVFVPGGDEWAQAMRRRPLPRGLRWVVLGVKATNLSRSRFNGNTLAYRLRAGGRLIAPRFSGGTGPESLVRTGRLRRGTASLTQLGFEVPRGPGRLGLVFEPRAGGSVRVHVALP
ncbi:MAG: hypothetical protein Q8K79_07170 [Solirubrobacteraceae bacterium]|nr:hypothetical protein [Solirubrobacteraceae bacterium]